MSWRAKRDKARQSSALTVVSIASAWRSPHEERGSGGLKGRGGLGEARHVKHRSEARSADCGARVERAEGFLPVCCINSDS